MDFNIFQYPTGNFLSSNKFREFFLNFPEISNSGIPFSFSGPRQDGNWPVPIGGTETGMAFGNADLYDKPPSLHTLEADLII